MSAHKRDKCDVNILLMLLRKLPLHTDTRWPPRSPRSKAELNNRFAFVCRCSYLSRPPSAHLGQSLLDLTNRS